MGTFEWAVQSALGDLRQAWIYSDPANRAVVLAVIVELCRVCHHTETLVHVLGNDDLVNLVRESLTEDTQ